MSKRDKTISSILEILHPVLLTAIVGPMIYAVYEKRVDNWILPLYLAAFCLLPLSAAVRISVKKARSFRTFAAISLVMFAVTVAAGKKLPDYLFGPASADSISMDSVSPSSDSPDPVSPGFLSPAPTDTVKNTGNAADPDAFPKQVPSILVLLETILGGGWIAEGALRLRTRENLRRRARMEADHTWQEKSILMQKPGLPCLALFAAAYLAGLFNACPPLCNIAIGSGLAYLIIALVYRSIEVQNQYSQETENLVNVPRSKIRAIRGRLLAVLIVTLCLVSVSAVFTAGGRRYRDLRKMQLQGVKIEQLYGTQDDSCTGNEITKIIFGLGIDRERHDSPKWLLPLERLLAVLVFGGAAYALLVSVWRALIGTTKNFQGRPEENGDIATGLADIRTDIVDPDSAGGRLRRILRGQPLTEQEKIRREYRRTIRRYRKEKPQRSETPAEIENATDFPEGFDVAALHESYEKVRYRQG